MSTLREKLNELKELRSEYHEKSPTLTNAKTAEYTAKIKAAMSDLSDFLAHGADDCPDGHGKPTGMFHDGTPKPFMIACLVCGKATRGTLQEDAIEDWNAGNYLPPREPGTVEATHRDASGKVKSQKTVKLQPAG